MYCATPSKRRRVVLNRFTIAILLTLTAANATAQLKVKELRTLVVIYAGAEADKEHMDPAAIQRAKNGAELGRLFYFRNSLGRLNCALDWMVIDALAPKNDGPTMEHIEADLRQRGIKPGEYDGVFVTGLGLSGNWGGFDILDGTAACFGGHSDRGELTWYPDPNPNVAYGTAWNFAHEFQHAIDLVSAEKSNLKMMHAHPYTDRGEPFFKGLYQGGEHWDWIACTFREFDDWLAIRGVRNTILECKDSDGDGLADDDPRLPADEKRFGSDPNQRDTDGDGLDDLGEFAADRYAGSDPRKPDTDGDCLIDGEDPWPVVAIAPQVDYVEHASDGASRRLLTSVFARNDAGGACEVEAGWDETTLYFRFVAPRPCVIYAKIDGSASNGFWEGGDTYLLRIAEGDVKLDGLGLGGPVSGATAVPVMGDSRGWVLDVRIPAALGQGVSKEINYGGKRDAADVADGLTLVPGRGLGFNFAYEFPDKTRAALTPHHTMYSARLSKPASIPDRPMLRGPRVTSAAAPAVEVLGIRPDVPVELLVDGKHAGGRVGPGIATLADECCRADGERTVVARCIPVSDAAKGAGAQSPPLMLRIDRTAAPPAFSRRNGAFEAECEPNGRVELWWGIGDAPLGVFSATGTDANGKASITAKDAGGWTVTAFDGSRFERRVFVDVWPKAERMFEMSAPDARLGADDFSLRLEGFLNVESPGLCAFELTSDDGGRLWIDGELVVNHWGHHGMSPRVGRIALSAGRHAVRVDYYEEDGWAGLKLRWRPPGAEWTSDLPVSRIPVDIGQVQWFGVQVDALGNRSAPQKF